MAPASVVSGFSSERRLLALVLVLLHPCCTSFLRPQLSQPPPLRFLQRCNNDGFCEGSDVVGSSTACSRFGNGFAASLAAAALMVGVPAFAGSDGGSFLQGSVVLQAGLEAPPGDAAALYVTVRPDKPDNVPRAILDGSRGKAPPVLTARFPVRDGAKSFPFPFELGKDALTEEGGAEGGEWWAKDDLIVSARLDTDGNAATRDPTDLVGRAVQYKKAAKQEASIYRRSDGGEGVEVRLQDRGLGGKFATAKNNK